MANEEHVKRILDAGVEGWNDWREKNPEIKPDLRSADLSNRDLTGINLADARLKGCNFSNTILSRARMSRAILKKAILTRAKLDDALLDEANLKYATLNESNLIAANLRKAMIYNASLGSANLSSATLSYADLRYAKLKSAVLRDVNATHARFEYADFSHADLNNGNFTSAYLRGANLETTVWEKVNFRLADLRNTKRPAGRDEEYDGPLIREHAWYENLLTYVLGKKLAVLGDRAVGKSSFIHFLTHGSALKEYHPTKSSVTHKTSFSANGISFYTILSDISGNQEEAYNDWLESFKNCDRLIYLFDASKIRQEEDAPKPNYDKKLLAKLSKHMELIYTWRNEGSMKRKSKTHLVGTHFDLDPLYHEKGDANYRKKIESLDFVSKAKMATGMDAKVVTLHLANLSTLAGAQILVEEMFKS